MRWPSFCSRKCQSEVSVPACYPQHLLRNRECSRLVCPQPFRSPAQAYSITQAIIVCADVLFKSGGTQHREVFQEHICLHGRVITCGMQLLWCRSTLDISLSRATLSLSFFKSLLRRPLKEITLSVAAEMWVVNVYSRRNGPS